MDMARAAVSNPSLDEYIKAVTRGDFGFSRSESGLTYANCQVGGFDRTGVPRGNIDALVEFILEREPQGLLVDKRRQIGIFCNYAHAHDVAAQDLLEAIVSRVDRLGTLADSFQRTKADWAREALAGLRG